LLAFEQILTGGVLADEGQLGLEEHIDQISAYLRPLAPRNSNSSGLQQAPEAFLPWLASWVALSLRDDWNEATKRRFIGRMVPLYRKRGTKEGLKELLELYVRAVSGKDEKDEDSHENGDNSVEIYEFEHPAHYFQVTIKLPLAPI
jgi:phage tail-like protein